jgi:hypothetical protein
MIVIPSASEKDILDFALGTATPGNQKMKLYVNDVTPDDASVAATFTEMSTLTYAEKALVKANWVSAAGAAGQPAASAYAQQAWAFGAGAAVTVYGYYVVDATTGRLLWAERFANPKLVGNAGDQILITPSMTLSRT